MKNYKEIMDALRKSCKGKKVDVLLHDLSDILYELENTKKCDNCDGEGHLECTVCDGTGMQKCDECYGSGRLDLD